MEQGECQSRDEPRDRGAEVRARIVPELGNEWMAFEGGLHDATLDAVPASVHQPEIAVSRGVCRADILVDDQRNIAWSECVQIEFRPDVNAVDVGHVRRRRSS